MQNVSLQNSSIIFFISPTTKALELAQPNAGKSKSFWPWHGRHSCRQILFSKFIKTAETEKKFILSSQIAENKIQS